MPFQKILSVVFFVFIGFRSFGYQISNPDNSSLIFIENKNQWSDDVYFSAQLPVGAIYLYDNSFRFFLTDVERLSHKHKKYEDRQLYENGDKACIEEKGIQNHSYNVNFVNANTKVSPFGKGKTKQYYNYFLGADSTKWASKAHGYTEVNYENLYNAIDLKVYSRYKLPKYDFVVRPGGNPSDILLQYNGVDDIYVFNDQLYIETSLGLVKEDVPVVYQIIDGERISVNAKYVLDCDVLSFQFPEGYNDHEELIIDPLLIFSTYSGSSADNWGNTATPGENGKFYSGGITNHFRGDGSGGSNFLGEFPSTIGAYQTTWGGIWDVAIIKYDSTGSQVEYATYLGGSGSEVPHSIIMDNDENLVIFGTTNSTDFPTTSNAYLKSFQGGVSHETILGEIFANGSDVFVAKLSKDGSQLMASTYFGGNGNDGQNLSISPLTKNYGDEQRGEVFIDEQNNIYISSVTNSKNLFDATPKSFDKSYNGGLSDAILVKFNSELSDVVFGGYFGGAGADASYAIKIGSDNTVYFAGGTDSHDLPITNGTLCETLNGNVDGWIARVIEQGDSIVNATYLGTSEVDQVYFIDVDESGGIYALGQTSGSYPIVGNVYSNTGGGQFIHKLNVDLSSTFFSTVFGSINRYSPNISLTAFLVSECDNMYVTGWGNSQSNFQDFNYFNLSTLGLPTTNDAMSNVTNGDDFYLMVLDTDASELLYATFFGGYEALVHVDGGTSRFDKKGVVYHSVCASCNGDSSFPTTDGAWSTTNGANGGCNNAAFKFDLASLRARFRTNSLALDNPGLKTICIPDPIVFENVSIGGEIFEWDFGDGTTKTKLDTTQTIHEYLNPGTYKVTLTAIDETTCIGIDKTSITVQVFEGDFLVGDNATICSGDDFKLEAFGGTRYYWYDKDVTFYSYDQFPVVQPEDTTTYYVYIEEDTKGCGYLDSVLVNVIPEVKASFSIEQNYNCFDIPEIEILNTSENANEYYWDFGDGIISTDEFPNHEYDSGIYKITLRTVHDICSDQISQTINMNPIRSYNVITPVTSIGVNDYFVIESPYPIHLTVVNRWGKVVFEAEVYENNWNAEGEPSGVYFYDISIAGKQQCKGWVQVFK